MAERMVKCKICGKKIPKSKAFPRPMKNLTYYYCNEDEFLEWQRSGEIRKEMYDIIEEVIGQEVAFGTFNQKMKSFRSDEGRMKIISYINDNKAYLTKLFSDSQKFPNASGKINYLCAILLNKLPCYSVPVNSYRKDEESAELSEDEKNLVCMEVKSKKVEKNPSLTDMEDWF